MAAALDGQSAPEAGVGLALFYIEDSLDMTALESHFGCYSNPSMFA